MWRWSLSVVDAQVSDLDCNGDAAGDGLPVAVAVDGSVTCTASHVLSQPDIDAGVYCNTASASALGASVELE